MPTAIYIQAIISTVTGPLFAFMAAPPVRHHWVPVPPRAAAGSPRRPAARALSPHSRPCLDATHSLIRTVPTPAQFPHTPVTSTPASDGALKSHVPSPHCRGTPPNAAPSLPPLPAYPPASQPPALAEPPWCYCSVLHPAACAAAPPTTSSPPPDPSQAGVYDKIDSSDREGNAGRTDVICTSSLPI